MYNEGYVEVLEGTLANSPECQLLQQ